MNVIWATRGRTWGFRFLLDGDYSDPLPAYDRVFSGLEGQPSLCLHVGPHVALRFPDPLGRQDAAGRVIPHDFVILEPLTGEEPFADKIESVEDGLQKVWPSVSDVFAQVWHTPRPPDAGTIRAIINRNSSDP